ncbi:MAG TPA: hypothetical protein VN285_10690, partial [Candidatus Deferrimicrobium sp.]|nr:hypothetical protein [Candidatus Deferrimicrobium sp.]
MILSVYYICIASLFAISFFPHYRIWGLNWWAYFPLWVQCGLLGIGVVIPVIMWLVSKSVHGRGGTQGTNSKSPGRYLTISPALCVLFGLVFYFLCARTHFLGDGYTLLSLLAADNPLIKPRELGESLIHIWVKWLVGGTGEPAALLSFQIVSIASGTLLVSFVAYAARRLFERNIDRILFLLGVSTGGYMLLYFGYVENYALFVLSVTVYVLTGLLALTNRVRRRLILPPLVLACLFHVLGFTLIPSAAYVLLADTKIGRAMSRLNGRQKALVAISLPAILSILFAYFYLTSYYFRFAFVPLMQNRFTVEGYTLFSLNHLLDYLNLLFLLAPAMPMVIAAVIRVGPKTLLKIRAHRYLFI